MKQNFEQRYEPVETSCEYCGKPIVTSAWNVPVFCHDDCAHPESRSFRHRTSGSHLPYLHVAPGKRFGLLQRRKRSPTHARALHHQRIRTTLQTVE